MFHLTHYIEHTVISIKIISDIFYIFHTKVIKIQLLSLN